MTAYRWTWHSYSPVKGGSPQYGWLRFPRFRPGVPLVLLVTLLLLGCSGIDKQPAVEAQKGIGDTEAAEESYLLTNENALTELEKFHAAAADRDAEVDILKAKDADGKLTADQALSILKANASDRAANAGNLRRMRLNVIKGLKHFGNALQVQRATKGLLEALADRKDAEVEAKTSGMQAIERAGAIGKKVITGGVR